MILSDKTIKLLCAKRQFRHSRHPHLLSAEEALKLIRGIYPNGVRNVQVTNLGSVGARELSFGRSLPTVEELMQAPHDQLYTFSTLLGGDQSTLQVIANPPMISPFQPTSVRRIQNEGLESFPILSSGTSSYGYDVTLAEEFKIFTNVYGATIDPKRFDPKCLIDGELQHDPLTGEKWVILPPSGYLLGRTPEWFDIPRDKMVIAVGKSTYARAGAIVNVTPIEAGFRGNVVIEISNPTQLPMRIYANEGCAQFLFFQGDQPCEVSYDDRAGKYQDQSGLRLSEV